MWREQFGSVCYSADLTEYYRRDIVFYQIRAVVVQNGDNRRDAPVVVFRALKRINFTFTHHGESLNISKTKSSRDWGVDVSYCYALFI